MDSNDSDLPEKTETAFDGLEVSWYNNSTIVLYRLQAVSYEVLDNWASYVLTVLEAWPKDKPYLAVHDLSQSGVSLQYAALVNFDMMNVGVTVNGRAPAEKVFDQHEAFIARVAINFNLSLSGQTNRALMNPLSEMHPSVRYRTFYNLPKSFKWLRGELRDTTEMRALRRQRDQPDSSANEGSDNR